MSASASKTVNQIPKTSALDALRIVLAKSVPEFVDRHLSFPGIGLTEEDITVGRGAAAISCKVSRNGQLFDLEIAEQRFETNDALKEDKYGAHGTRDIPVPPAIRKLLVYQALRAQKLARLRLDVFEPDIG